MSRNWVTLAFQRLLGLVTEIRPDELQTTLRLAARIFLVMVAYYLLKPTREALILADGSAELRSYAVAFQAGLMFLVLPLYSHFSRRYAGEGIFVGVTLFFISNLGLFYFLGTGGARLGLVFFIWLGIFNVTQIAQFWALAAHVHTVQSGQRLFAFIALGGSLGAVVGSQLAEWLFEVLGPFQLMLVAMGVLFSAIFAGGKLPGRAEGDREGRPTGIGALLGGLVPVLRSPYLRKIALFVVLLNCINTIGEFILAEMVVGHVEATLSPGESKEARIGAFYADFFAWVNLLTLLFQLFLVSRLYRTIGVQGALLVLPLIALSGYMLMAFFPVFAVVRVIKVLENSTDYSIQTTTRHVLFLPETTDGKYAGKTTIETLFWRMGDLLQAGVVFLGVSYLGFKTSDFALFNLGLAVLWLLVAFRIARSYQVLAGPLNADGPYAGVRKTPATAARK
ncbi:NTP/NDP exchange transporter [Thiohalorhabdus methylotrophus]|uniref:ADP,ATP carrier protein n=1 Tax=Thiohalorhabdus methylotrophus TaxID=3242694 RepID=A0ABV4TRW5_9GAMM